MVLERTPEKQEGRERVPQVIRPFGEVAIGGETQVELGQEAGPAVLVLNEAGIVVPQIIGQIGLRNAVEGALHEGIVVHHQTDHPDGGAAPSGMVVDAVEELGVFDGKEVRHRPEEFRVELLTGGFVQPVVDVGVPFTDVN